MNNAPISDVGAKSPFAFWKRPEGKTGLIFNGLLIGAGVYYWGKILPFLLSIFEDTIKLGVMAGVIAIFLYPDTRRLIWFAFKSVMRAITKMFVDIDAIGVLRSLIQKMKKRKTEFENVTGEIRQQRQKLKAQLDSTAKEFERSMSALETAEVMQKDRNPEKARIGERTYGLEAKQSKRMKSLLTEQQTFMSKYDVILAIMVRYGEVCDDMILDMTRDIQFRKQQQDQSRSFRKGMRSANSIMRGSTDDEEMRDLAIESLETEYGSAMGEVENILALTKDVILRADFNDAQAITEATKRLAEWKNTGGDVQLSKSGMSKQNLIAEAERSAGIVLDIPSNSALPIRQSQAATGGTKTEIDW